MLLTAILCSLFCSGLWSVTKYETDGNGNIYGLILAPLGKYAHEHLPQYIYKPLLGCINCMASFWGILFYCYKYYKSGNVCECIIFIFVVSALNGIYGKYIES
jgi:hypothetical protein